MFIGRESRYCSGKDRVIDGLKWFKNGSPNALSYWRRILYIVYGIKTKGEYSYDEIPYANEILSDMNKNNDYGFAIMNISKFEARILKLLDYIKNKNKHITELQKKLIFELNEYKNLVLLYTEADLQRKDLPTGFSFELWRYMIMDTIIHPVMHLLYYLIKTKNYKLFFKLCKKYNDIFYCYAKGNLEVYSFYEYIEDSKKFIENIKELGEQYKNDDMIHAVLKANKIDGNI